MAKGMGVLLAATGSQDARNNRMIGAVDEANHQGRSDASTWRQIQAARPRVRKAQSWRQRRSGAARRPAQGYPGEERCRAPRQPKRRSQGYQARSQAARGHDLSAMRAPALLAMLLLGACASSTAPVIGGADYAPQYDFSEFYAATNGRTFRVVVGGNPFPQLSQPEMQRRLLPVMQASRPRPRLTFTYDVPSERPRPDYYLVL